MRRDVHAPTRLFVYGTLLFDAVRARVAGRALPARPATLPGYARRAVHGAVYPGVVREPGAATHGLLVEGVDARALARLDRFEGRLYERRRLPVRLAEGGFVHAGVYLVPPARRRALADAPWDPDAFAARHLEAYLEGCAAFDAAARRRRPGGR